MKFFCRTVRSENQVVILTKKGIMSQAFCSFVGINAVELGVPPVVRAPGGELDVGARPGQREGHHPRRPRRHGRRRRHRRAHGRPGLRRRPRRVAGAAVPERAVLLQQTRVSTQQRTAMVFGSSDGRTDWR